MVNTAPALKLQADFNGLFGDLLCLSHNDSCRDESGEAIPLVTGMVAIAFEEDIDERGQREYLVAQGIVEPSPDWLQCRGSKRALRIDGRGVRHEPQFAASV
jgi:hypothetical protein